MAFVIANELGVNIKQTSGPVIEKAGDLVAFSTIWSQHDVLFIDEIHRMPMAVEEILYSAMEDFYIDIMIGAGEASRSVHLGCLLLPDWSNHSCGMLSIPAGPFWYHWSHGVYELADLTGIVERTADIFDMELPMKRDRTGSSFRGPSIANRLLQRVRILHRLWATV